MIVLPPANRSRVMQGLTAAAARGQLELQECEQCGAVQYPPREACHVCLSTRLPWRPQAGSGELLAVTAVHVSQHPYFRERTPWRVGVVRLDAGPSVITHVHRDCPPPPARVRVGAQLDKAGVGVLIAFPAAEPPDMTRDPQLREMTCDPQGRSILVMDGATATGEALVAALADAGAARVWVGESSAGAARMAGLKRYPQVSAVPLDIPDAQSIARLAESMRGQINVLVHNADAAESPADLLARAFGPALIREVDEVGAPMRAWVNVLSSPALDRAAFSQSLRADLRPLGVRVINVFPGPREPAVWAAGVIAALRSGVEEVFPSS